MMPIFFMAVRHEVSLVGRSCDWLWFNLTIGLAGLAWASIYFFERVA